MNIASIVNKTLSKLFGIKLIKSDDTPVYYKFLYKHINIAGRATSISKFPLHSYIKDVKSAFYDSLKAPKFLATGKSQDYLNIPVNRKINSVKIELPTTQHLHLHSITLLGKRGVPIVLKKPTVKVSSQAPRHKFNQKDILKKFLDSSGSHLHAFHTDYEENPYVTLSFSNDTYVTSLIINNKRGFTAVRATGLTVSIASDHNNWKKIYALGGLESFRLKVAKINYKYNITKYKLGTELCELICIAIQGDNTATKPLYKKLPEEHRKVLVDPLNENVLHERKMELISHGVKHSFRFWSENKKQRYINTAMQLVDDLEELSDDVCFGFGSVLAVVRDKDLLPHDNDMDTIIAFNKTQFSNINKAKTFIKLFLEKKGYTVDNLYTGWHVRRDGFMIDIFISIYSDDDSIGWYPAHRNNLKRSDIFPAKYVSLLGVKCKIPKKPEKYLAAIYGSDWRSPDPHHVHKYADTREQYIK